MGLLLIVFYFLIIPPKYYDYFYLYIVTKLNVIASLLDCLYHNLISTTLYFAIVQIKLLEKKNIYFC